MHSREVVFVILPDVVLLDLAGPVDAFRNANNRVPGSYRLRFVGAERSAPTAAGLSFSGLEPLPPRLAPGTILVLTGIAGTSIDPQQSATRLVIEWLRSTANPTQLLCVCAGSVLAARAGLLAGRECTTHHAHLEELRRAEPRARVLDNRVFVEDGPVFTSAGVTAGLDLALHVIGRQLGPRVAAEIARELVVYLRRAGTDPALSPWVMHRNHLHPAVHRVQDAVTRDPAARWSSAQLAAVACTSARNLSRLFAASPDVRESNLAPIQTAELKNFVGKLNPQVVRLGEKRADASGAGTELWRSAIWALLALVVVESCLAAWVGRESR